MADKFAKFIETGGKSLNEIKDEIRRMLGSKAAPVKDAPPVPVEDIPPVPVVEIPPVPVVEIPPVPVEKIPPVPDDTAEDIRRKIAAVVDDAKRTAQSIPRPEKIPPRPDRVNISYATGKPVARRELTADELAYPSEQPSEQADVRPEDAAMNERIAEMRKLNEVFYNGYMLKRCAEESIVKQGLFMADVTDDYGRRAFCGTPRPIYAALSNAQLRTYFTWRTDVRRGVYRETDKPYVQLYCYELLNVIGCISPADAFGRLLGLWENARGWAGWLDGAMPRWLKDFYAYNDISEQYPDISSCLKWGGGVADETAAAMFNRHYEGCMERLMEHSAYNLRGSRFMTEDGAKLMDGALTAVLSALDGYFDERGISLFEILCGRLKKDFSWTPFAGAYVNLDRMGKFRAVRINALERYCLKRGEPVLERLEPAPCRGFIGYVLKSTEAELRRATGFRHSLTTNITMALNDFRNRDKLIAAVSDDEFSGTISRTVREWCLSRGIRPEAAKADKPRKRAVYDDIPPETPREPPNIVIDVTRLAGIREQSDELAKKLIVAEEEEIPVVRAEEISEAVAEEDFSERVAACAEYSRDFSALPDGWRDFAQLLDETEISVLSALCAGNAAEFCRSAGELPEAVYERINTAALDTVADIVIENGELIPDYEEDIRRVLDCAGV